MSFTEFCCRSGGSNLNAGTRTGNSTEPGTSADLTYASGSWVSATGVFTVASGNPTSDGVAVGDFASVYADGASVTTLVGRVTARTSTTITVSTSAKSGTTTDGTSNRTLKIGGAWQGPNGSSGFPITFLTTACVDASSNLPRINLKNDATYNVTAEMNTLAAIEFRGYSSVYEDHGKATIDGGTSGASYTIFGSTVAAGAVLADMVVQNNGATGSAVAIYWNSAGGIVEGVVCHDVRGIAFRTSGATLFIECEAYNCNQSATSGIGIYFTNQGSTFLRCIAHDNAGANVTAFYLGGAGCSAINCIADTNGGEGFFATAASGIRVLNCDSYNNGNSNYRTNSATGTLFENCNSIKPAVYDFNIGNNRACIVNCGVGSGSMAAGTSSLNINASSGSKVVGTVTYASGFTPWVDPDNGDFRIDLATAKGAGRGSFLQTASSYAGTVGYPDIGSAQHQDSGGGSSRPSHPLLQQVIG